MDDSVDIEYSALKDENLDRGCADRGDGHLNRTLIANDEIGFG